MELEELCNPTAIVLLPGGFLAILKAGFNYALDVQHESFGKQLNRLAKLGRSKIKLEDGKTIIFLFYLREYDPSVPLQRALRELYPDLVLHQNRPTTTQLRNAVKGLSARSPLVGPDTFGAPSNSNSPKPVPRPPRRRVQRAKANQNLSRSHPGTPSPYSNEFSVNSPGMTPPYGTPSGAITSYSAPATPYHSSSAEESSRSNNNVSFSPFNFAAAMRITDTPPQESGSYTYPPYAHVPLQSYTAPETDTAAWVSNTNVVPRPSQRRVIQHKKLGGSNPRTTARRLLTFGDENGTVSSVVQPSIWLGFEQVRTMEVITQRADLEGTFHREILQYYQVGGTACNDFQAAHLNQFGAQHTAAEYPPTGANIEYTGQWAIDIFSPPTVNTTRDVPTARSTFSGHVGHGTN